MPSFTAKHNSHSTTDAPEVKEMPLHTEVVDENNDPKELPRQAIKSSPRIIAYTALANIGSLAFGFDMLVTGAVTAMPAFSMTFGEQYNGRLILPALWQGLWTAFIQLGMMMGAALSAPFQDRFGRRMAFVLGGIVSAIGTALSYASPESSIGLTGRRTVFLFAKLIIGSGIGVLMTTCQTYVSEISPLKLRGAFLAVFAFATSIGQLIAITIVFSRVMIMDVSSYRIPFALQWAFSGLAIVCGLIVPESPFMLMAREQPAAARKAYLRLHGSKADVDLALSKIQAVLDHEKEQKASGSSTSFAECFMGSDRRRSFIVILVALLQYFLGVSLLANANYFLIMAGMSPTQSLQISQIGIGVQIVCICIASVTMTYFGRRVIVLCSCAATGIVFIGQGAAGFFQNDTSALRFIGISILLVGAISTLGVGAAWPVLISELSSVRLRAKSSAIGFMTNALAGVVFSVSVPYMFNADAGNLGGKIGFIFAFLCFLGLGLSWLYLPETRAKSFEELDYLFERKTPARQFKKAVYDQ
ncbi:general substrate transporter [Corynespora cassiicola Philippines]|uniref:General substrate transporter n=1 Tax=Corynespora cassiicola Philippines TaxID=1448308 RepID=A0A2T2P992_CORCC|nr:general substrate transporter [Corynespora cassiicola Philippines]